MPRIRSAFVSVLFLAPVLAAAACSSGAGDSGERTAANTPSGGLDGVTRVWHTAVCPETPRLGSSRCMAHVVTDSAGKVIAAATPQGLGPADLASAYKLPTTGGTGATVAVVDANGQRVPTASDNVTFSVTGPGTYLGGGNGDPACHTADKSLSRPAFHGYVLAVIQGAAAPGTITVKASAAGFNTVSLTIDVVAAPLGYTSFSCHQNPTL